jgi:hypothetical protein
MMKTLAHFENEMQDLNETPDPAQKRKYKELLNQLVHKKVYKAHTPSSNANSAPRARHFRASVDESAQASSTHRAK